MEDIMRKIRELEAKIKVEQEKAEYVKSIINIIREEHPELTHSELLMISPEYRHSYFTYLALQRWIKTWQSDLEKLRKMIPPYTHKRIRLTFSIETGRGKEPFLAEVTCNTVIPKEMDEQKIEERIVNASIKCFWILFDTYKDITKDMKAFWGTQTYSDMLKRAIFFQKYATEIHEEAMDDFLLKLMELGGLSRPADEYVTTEAILNIGVETPMPEDETAEPKYPKIHLFIDKKTEYSFTKELIIKLAPETRFNILRKLGIFLDILS